MHPVGTRRMGKGADAVVDSQLRVHGSAGLRVVDTSVMPPLIGGNTDAPTIMIDEKAAEMILSDLAKSPPKSPAVTRAAMPRQNQCGSAG